MERYKILLENDSVCVTCFEKRLVESESLTYVWIRGGLNFSHFLLLTKVSVQLYRCAHFLHNRGLYNLDSVYRESTFQV